MFQCGFAALTSMMNSIYKFWSTVLSTYTDNGTCWKM